VGLVAALGVALVALAALAFWLVVVRAPARARRHVPSNANLVVRLDLVEVATFPPAREHLGPVLERMSADRGAPGRDRLREETGIDLARDVREVVLASVDGLAWVAVFGGRLERGRFLAGMQRLLADGAPGAWRLEGDLLVGPMGAVVAQADDGAVVVGSDLALVRAALPATDDAASIGLPEGGAVAFALTKRAFEGAAGAASALPHGGTLASVAGASGTFALGREPALTARLEAARGDADALLHELEPLLDEARVGMTAWPDLAGEKAALRSARLRVDGTAVVLDAPWPYDELDHALARLGRLAGRALPPPAASSAAP
jgi:hypothetical protein